MSFITDKQTTDELSLTGRYKNGSCFGLFNNTHTQGGERLLEEWLGSPLTDKDTINERASVFRYFQERKFTFPIDGKIMSDFSDWADGGQENLLRVLKDKALSSLVKDERYGRRQEGLKAAAAVLRGLYTFIEKHLDDKDAGMPFSLKEKTKYAKSILSDNKLEKLRLLAGKTEISTADTAYYGKLLKGTMRKTTESLLRFIDELDVCIAVGKAAADKGFRYAEATEGGNNLTVKNLRHPALDKGVGNDIQLDGSRNLLFLTGANMAGKSTLMKSIGTNLYLAHCGFPVAADEMSFTVKDGLFSSINVPDNISLGYSHFYAEVMRVKQAAQLVSQNKRLLVMFDELFKGTNVKDAYEGTLEVTKAFARYPGCLFVVSTHIIEVGDALRDVPNIQFAYMPTEMDGNRPRYPYKMREGITEDRQGMMIIQNEGILELLG